MFNRFVVSLFSQCFNHKGAFVGKGIKFLFAAALFVLKRYLGKLSGFALEVNRKLDEVKGRAAALLLAKVPTSLTSY